jgi:hypothetical protein
MDSHERYGKSSANYPRKAITAFEIDRKSIRNHKIGWTTKPGTPPCICWNLSAPNNKIVSSGKEPVETPDSVPNSFPHLPFIGGTIELGHEMLSSLENIIHTGDKNSRR